MSCSRCESDQIASVQAKCNDCFDLTIAGERVVENDYVAGGLNIGDDAGDYISFEVCLDCGQMQGAWPAIYEPQ